MLTFDDEMIFPFCCRSDSFGDKQPISVAVRVVSREAARAIAMIAAWHEMLTTMPQS